MDISRQPLKITSNKKGKDFWGPVLWGLIHVLSYLYKEGTEKELLDFLWSLTFLLPCDFCKDHLAYKLKNYPPTKYIKQGRKGVFLYSYFVHDLANQHITKYNKKTPKSSPPYEDVVEYYKNLVEHTEGKWFSYVWASIHILSATLRQESSTQFKKFLYSLCVLLPKESGVMLYSLLEKHPIDPYLRNNNDAFFYSYMLHDIVNRKLGKSSPLYKDVKSYYFSSLGEECSDCKV